MVAKPVAAQASKAVIAYVFVKDRVLSPDEIAAGKLTRINYAFANIQDGEIAEGFAHDGENFAILAGLKVRNPHLQVLVSVGGWTWSGGFSDMSLTAASRQKFIESAVRFVNKYSLDGLDIDWEYPGLSGIGNPNRPEDKDNYTALLHELRVRFDHEEQHLGKHLYTSIATGASLDFLAHTDMRNAARYVDTVNLMAYDYYEPSSDALTGHHAPLFTNPADPKAVSADASVKAYVAAGVPSAKLVLGVPFYGHAWSAVNDVSHGLFQAAKPASVPASYRDIPALIAAGYVRYWDPVSSAPYLYNPATRIFVSFEDPESVALKAKYVLHHHLRGIMFWEYAGDSNGELLDSINAALKTTRTLPPKHREQ